MGKYQHSTFNVNFKIKINGFKINFLFKLFLKLSNSEYEVLNISTTLNYGLVFLRKNFKKFTKN